MAVITQAEVKTLLQITDSTYDALITALIPIVEDYVKNYCNNEFTDGYPVGLKGIVAKIIYHNIFNKDGVLKFKRGQVSVEYPDNIYKQLDAYKAMKVV